MSRQTSRSALNPAEVEERANALFTKGMALYQGNPREAIGLFAEALRLAKRGKHHSLIAKAMTMVAACHEVLSDYPAALLMYANALRAFRKLKHAENEGLVLFNIGIVYNRMARFDDAVEMFSQALKIQEGLGNKKKIEKILGPLGRSYLETGQYGAAIDALTRDLHLCEEMGNEAGMVTARAMIALVYSDITEEVGDVEFRSGELPHIKGKNVFGDGRSLAGLGQLSTHLGQFDEALEYLRRSLAVNREIGSRYGEVTALSTMGKTYLEKGDLENALRCCSEAIAIADDIGPVDETVFLFRTLGHIHSISADIPNAIKYYHLALSLAEQRNNRRLQPKLHGLLSELYEELGDIPNAYEHYKRGTTLKSEMGMQGAHQLIARLQSVMQKERAEREKEAALMKASQFELEITHKERELAAMALNLRMRDDMVEALRTNLDVWAASSEEEAKKMLRDFLQDLEKEKATQTFHAFQSEIDRSQQELNRTLSQRFPRLTAAELRICSLLRGNMSTKEIADILCVTTRNVETHRYHIRQKMRLPKEASLISFLVSL